MKNCGDSLIEEQDLFQSQSGGVIPTSPLQMWVYETSLQELRPFIEKWHYSKSVNGLSSKHCFKLCLGNNIIGACIFGRMAMRNQYKKYAKKESDVIELRRLCCIDDTPKNTESFFISKCIKKIRAFKYKIIVSYADLSYGHIGIIYKASNFKLIGQTTAGKIIEYNGKKYHDHAIRTKYKGKLKPFAEKLRAALQCGDATLKKVSPKNIYVYEL